MPIGGLGAGCICINGSGGLQDFSIRTRPKHSLFPQDSLQFPRSCLRHPSYKRCGPGHEAGRRARFRHSKSSTRDCKDRVCAAADSKGFRALKSAISAASSLSPRFALPTRLSRSTYRSLLGTPSFRSTTRTPAFRAPSLNTPCTTPHREPVDYEFSYHLSHLAPGCRPDQAASANAVIPGKGRLPFQSRGAQCRGLWQRHADCDRRKTANQGDVAAQPRLGVRLTVRPMARGLVRAHSPPMTVQTRSTMPAATAPPSCWTGISTRANRTPTRSLSHGTSPTAICAKAESRPAQNAAVIEGQPGCRTVPADAPPPWHPYYSTLWKDAREVAAYVEQNYPALRTRTIQFKNAIFNSTFPPYVLDAVSANLAILKSPTILREANGNVWGWEGCFPDAGCCHGSCTHVWNYAQAMPHLFPQLERTLRDLELVALDG